MDTKMLCGIRPLLSKQSQLWKMLKHILREIGRAILPRTQKITMERGETKVK